MPIAKERILFEDDWLLAVTKLGGELVVKGKGKTQRLPLLDFLRKDYPSLAPIHRLDYETSGVVVFAKSKNTLKTIVDSKFADWKKTYVAIVAGVPRKKEGSIDIPLPARSGTGNVPASTQYKLKESFRGCSLVEVHFERGQKHQIRRHLSMIGHPLILDDVYGDQKANRLFGRFLKMHRFFLHATSVEFPHPVTGKTVRIESPLPPVFERVLKLFKQAM
jgi:RluA family pseudouridine synthase